jgi:hypothetical protein
MDRMNADRLAAVMTDLRRHLNTCIPGSRLLRKDGAAASITGLPYAPFNSVWLEQPNPPVSAVAALLDEVAGAGPFSLSLRPGSDAVLADLAVERGMKSDGRRVHRDLQRRDRARVPGPRVRFRDHRMGDSGRGGGGRRLVLAAVL